MKHTFIISCILSVFSILSSTAQNTHYLDEEGNIQNVEATELTSQTIQWGTDGTVSWLVVKGHITLHERALVDGRVNLILTDGCELTLEEGVRVSVGDTISIFAQSTDEKMGMLTATAPAQKAAIGGDQNTAGDVCNAGSINIHGGHITATAQASAFDPAGIGGGAKGQAGSITITGGVVIANGSQKGIGSGAHNPGGSILISGGTITANGIGTGGYNASATTLIQGNAVVYTTAINRNDQWQWSGIVFENNSGVLYGETVTPQYDFNIGQGQALTIGSAQTLVLEENITLTNSGNLINNGTLTNKGSIHLYNKTNADLHPEVIEPGEEVYLLIRTDASQCLINGITPDLSNVTATLLDGDFPLGKTMPMTRIDGYWTAETTLQTESLSLGVHHIRVIFSSDTLDGFNGEGRAYLSGEAMSELTIVDSFSYIDEQGELRETKAIPLTEHTSDWKPSPQTNWYIAQGKISLSERINVNGDINLILADDCTLTAEQGIKVSDYNSLTIYRQSEGTGSLTAIYTEGGAAIGCNPGGVVGTISIHGGYITAISSNGGAGIGNGGWGSSGGNININGGLTVAQSSNGSERAIQAANVSFTGGITQLLRTSEQQMKSATKENCIVFYDSIGLTYGNAFIRYPFSIDSNESLTITEGSSLDMAGDASLTNHGTILNYGTFNHEVEGEGLVEYFVSTPQQLMSFSQRVNRGENRTNAYLLNNIMLNDTTGWRNWSETTSGLQAWPPVGNIEHPFQGILDGQGFAIEGIFINNGNETQGLVGLLGEEGRIRGIGIQSGYIRASKDVGGICGLNQNGEITNVFNKSHVEGSENVGGICGFSQSGKICHTYFAGRVEGDKNIGGICGFNQDSLSHNFYIKGSSFQGTGNGQGEAIEKDSASFAQGEVAYLLQEGQTKHVWGQDLIQDAFPTLGGIKVYRYKDSSYHNIHAMDEEGFYLISNADELKAFAALVNNGQDTIKGKLITNIVLNDISNWENWDENTEGLYEWIPMNHFRGTFDGQNHTISGIYICSEEDYQGFCGTVYGEIRNLGITASYIQGKNHVGSICGSMGYDYSGSTETQILNNCYFSGKILGKSNIGGICGTNGVAGIVHCHNSGKVEGEGGVGGICGSNSGSIMSYISYCYNTGNVMGGNSVGGICGSTSSAPAHCYNTGAIQGDENIGGVWGYLMSHSSNSIGKIFNTGNVTGNTSVGSIGGYCEGLPMMPDLPFEWSIEDCYWLEGSAQQAFGSGIENESNAQAKTAEEFASGEIAYALQGYSSTLIWGQLLHSDPHPTLGGAKVYKNEDGTYTNLKNVDADGTYLISNAEELLAFAIMVNNGHTDINGKLTADISFNDTTGWKNWNRGTSGLRQWIPIGKDMWGSSFSGFLDGQGHTISGLYANNWDYQIQGLVGNLSEGGSILNLNLEAGYIWGPEAGGICGSNRGGEIINCHNGLTVEGDLLSGGICGSNQNGKLEHCSNNGNIGSWMEIGGICGSSDGGSLHQVYNTGTINGDFSAGGIIGVVGNTHLSECYNTGKVIASMNGGLFASFEGSATHVYWQEGTASSAIGRETEPAVDTLPSHTPEQFRSGEVAYLLGEAWGQTLGSDLSPVWRNDSNQVFRHMLINLKETDTIFANLVVDSLPEPERIGYTFEGWFSDSTGGQAFVENDTLEADSILYAHWSINYYHITFLDEDSTLLQRDTLTYGQIPVFHGETPFKDSTTEFSYTFSGWTPEIDTVREDATYMATYAATRRSYTLSLSVVDSCTDMGTVSGAGTYHYGDTVSIIATANEGFIFLHWNDGDTNATREIRIISDSILTATFTQNPGTDSSGTATEHLQPEQPRFRVLSIQHGLKIEGSHETAYIYDATGRLVYRGRERTIYVKSSGIYIVLIGSQSQRVMVL